LIETTDWNHYGTESGNPKCANCMVSCGYEPSTVHHGFTSLSGFWGMVKATLSSTYADRGALDLLNQPLEHGRAPLVQIASSRSNELEGSHV
jgi:hypothetical protein